MLYCQESDVFWSAIRLLVPLCREEYLLVEVETVLCDVAGKKTGAIEPYLGSAAYRAGFMCTDVRLS